VDTWNAILSRRDVRSFESRPIPADDLDQILEAARRTPSSRNSQPWNFVVVTDRNRLQALSRVWRNAGHVARSAATIALVAPDGDRSSVQYDLGQVTMSIMLAAADLGIGSGHSLVTEHDLAAEILNLPPDRFCAWLIPLGYPADGPLRPIRHPSRRAFDDIVHREHW
jgi:nitroreductase